MTSGADSRMNQEQENSTPGETEPGRGRTCKGPGERRGTNKEANVIRAEWVAGEQ